MDLQLVGRTALISGSTKGIGFAIAELLAREGARVILNGRTEEAVSQARKLSAATNGAALRADGGIVRACFG